MPSDYDDSLPDDDYNLCVLNAQPVAYWPMGEASGDFADLTGNGYTGVVTDAVNLTYNSAALVETDPATAGPFAAFVSTSRSRPQVIVADAAPLSPAAAFSVEFWIRPTLAGATLASNAFTVLRKVAITPLTPPNFGRNGFSVGWIKGDDNLTFLFHARFTRYTGVVADNYDSLVASVPFAYDQTYHVVVRRDAADVPTFVVNGLLVAIGRATDNGIPTTDPRAHTAYPISADVRLVCRDTTTGAEDSGRNPPNAVVSHVAYYDYFLSDGMCVQHYAQGKAAFAQTDAVVTQPRQFTVYPAGTDDPYAAEPAGWETAAYDDSLWATAVVMTHNNDPTDADRQIPILTPASVPDVPAHTVWLTDDNIGEQPETDRLLFRLPFTLTTLPGSATVYYNPDNAVDLYLNGTLLLSDTGGSTPYATNAFYSLTAPDLALFATGANLFAARVTNAGTTPAAFAGPVGFFLWLQVGAAAGGGAYSWIQVW